MPDTDPFRHLPHLRDQIKPAADSFFRDGFRQSIQDFLVEHDIDPDFFTPDDIREPARINFLTDRPAGDFWVFAYGSLIWDPGIEFEEIRQAQISGYARRFCLIEDMGGRGTKEQPGLMAGLDTGPGCDGIAFRIAADNVERETQFLWQREMIAEGYQPAHLSAVTPQGPINAVTFLADHAARQIEPDLPHEVQVRYIATGEGILGTSFDYLDNLFGHLTELGIDDPHLRRLWEDVTAFRADRN